MGGYDYDESAAKKSESSRITTSGKYKGMFTAFYKIEPNDKGTVGVEFNFQSDDERTADSLRLYTLNGDGKEIYGFNILMAMLKCIGIAKLTEAEAPIEKWSAEEGRKIRVDVIIYPEIIRVPIGLLLQREEYRKSNGDVGSRMNVVLPFRYSDELTAPEIIEGKVHGETLVKRCESLRDKVLPSSAARQSSNQSTSTAAGDNDMPNDDIPW